jgi:hypothetical protein
VAVTISSKIPSLILVFITGTMALPMGIQINSRYYHNVIAALSKYDAYLLAVGGSAFDSIAGTTVILQIAFLIINMAMQQYILYFLRRYMAALHAAAGMFAIVQ